MSMVGDGPEGQPTEGVVESLDTIAAGMEPIEETAPDESEEGEESGESEGGEAEEEAEQTEEDEQEEQTFTIKHDGKDVTLKQSELVEMAQKGFDYSQKTMAVAKERDEVTQTRAQLAEMRKHSEELSQTQLERLTAIAHFAQAQVGEPPNIALAQENAAQYLAEQHLFNQRQGQLQQALQAVQQVQQETQRQRQAWIEQTAGETEKALRDTLPGWNEAMLGEYAKYADNLGLNPQTADMAFVQKGFWELIHKAKAFDALQEKRAQIKPKAELPKVNSPKASNPIPRGIVAKQAAEKNFRSKPSLDNLAALLD